MKKMNLLALTALLVGTATVGSAAAEELKLAHFMPPRHPMDALVMRPMTEELAKLTNNELTIRIYPAGELGKGPVQQYKRVVTGTADIAFGIPSYTPTQFTRTTLVHIPGLFTSPEQATETMWTNLDHIKQDFDQVKLLALWANNPAVLITGDKAVKSLADVKGMKIRAPNPVAVKIIEAWGGIPVSMPITKAYNAMSTGVVDAIMVGPSAIGSFKLHEVAKNITVNLPTAVDSFYILMNKGVWDGLSDDKKAAIEKVSGKGLSLKGAQGYKKAGDKGIALAKENGVNIIELDEATANEFREASKATLDEHVTMTGAEKNIPAGEIVEHLAGKTM